MKVLAVFAMSLTLCGCAPLILSAVIGPANKSDVHPPNAKDYESWENVPKVELETHPQFSLLPREVRHLSDGSEMWLLRFCPKGAAASSEECCLYQFVVRSSTVSHYRTAGKCGVNCSMRPESKVQACENAAFVPDGYR